MATTTAGLISAKFVVNASGQPAGNVWPQFRLLIDGVDAGRATVNTANPTAYTFTAQVAAGQAHRVQIHYDNDGFVNGQDRNLTVKSIEVNGNTLLPTQGTYDRGALDGRDVIAGQEGMWWQGALGFETPAAFYPAATSTPPTPNPAPTPAPAPAPVTGSAAAAATIVVNAHGTPAGGINARFNLLVDGVKVGEGVTGTTAKDFAFTANVAADQAHKVQIQYSNDGVAGGVDRNLFVNKITINGKAVAPNAPIVTYDRGALDGKDVIAGQGSMWWGGTLVVGADKSYFPGSTGGTPTPNPTPTGPAFYVAANGKDSWSGKLAAPNAAGTDGPFASLQAAQRAMRTSDVKTTYVREGDYYLKDQLWLDGQDSGVRIAAYGNEKPVLHGGALIDGWVSRGNGLWSAQLPTGSKAVLDLTMNGERQVLARTPNADPTKPIDGGWLIATKSAAGLDAATQFSFKPGDIPTTISTTGLMASVFTKHGYDNVLVPVKGIDFTKNVVTLAQSTWDTLGEGSRFYLFNGRDQLDAAREWFYDAATSQVLFRPEGGTPVGQKIVAAQNGVLIGLGGAKNVTIEGLTLADGGPNGHAVYAARADGLVFKDNVVKNVGYGITVETSPNAKVIGNSFSHTGLEAIFVKMGSNFAQVTDNLVQYAGAVDRASDGIWVNGSSDVKVTHNQIEHSAGKGIAVGSVDATGDATYRNTISFNKVIGSNRETSDGGGIYLINRQQDAAGHVVSYNEVTGTTAFGNVRWDGSVSPTWLDPKQLVSWGIYLDDWTSGTTVKGNVVHGNLGGVFLHGGWNNTVTNNVIAGNAGREIGLQQHVGWGGWKGTPMSGNLIVKNVVDATNQGLVVTIDGPKTAGTFTDNFYAYLDSAARLFQVWPQAMTGVQGTLRDWQAAGYDTGARVLDPRFDDPAKGDYDLSVTSPVYQHGFEAIPTEQIGLLP